MVKTVFDTCVSFTCLIPQLPKMTVSKLTTQTLFIIREVNSDKTIYIDRHIRVDLSDDEQFVFF